MKKTLLIFLHIYRRAFSPDTGMLKKRMPTCGFYPTCSAYSEEVIMKYGAMKGGYLSLRRILRCHPWQKEHVDFVP